METVVLPTPRVILGQYQQVLMSVSHLLPFGAPDTLLPHSRDKIRQAIRDVAYQITLKGLETNIHYEDLRVAYQSLASFVSYEEANIAARLQHALERNQFAFLATAEAESARVLSRQIEREAARLTREFDTWVSEASDPVLTEVDAMLADFERKLNSAHQ
jgi:hypothetical protein